MPTLFDIEKKSRIVSNRKGEREKKKLKSEKEIVVAVAGLANMYDIDIAAGSFPFLSREEKVSA